MSSTIAKQGIISILGSDFDQITKAASLRRTLSADMSSKHWLAQNGFPLSSMKRIASSEELADKKSGSSFSSYEQDEEPGQDAVWRLIQSQKKEVIKHGQDDIWASIVSQKANEEENSTLPPYVHPLVKRSTSALSEKSLEICTESLGSETGSDVFSSCAPSESGESEEDKDVTQVTQPQSQPQPQPQQEKEWQSFSLEKSHFAKYSTTKISAPKSFPPPLPSLAQRDGPSLHMQPRREDGRLVLEAVSIPSHNCFHAQRQDGRLLLTLANNTVAQELDLEEVVDEEEEIDELEEEVFNNFERKDSDYVTEEEEEESGEEDENEDQAIGKFQIVSGTKEFGFVMNQTPNYSKEVISVHRSALMMKRLIGLNNNRDPKWTEKLKKAANLVGMEAYLNPTAPLSQSLTGPLMGARLIQSSPVAGAAASFNACDYFWRTKPSMESTISPIAQNTSSLKMNTHNYTSPKLNQNQEMVLMKGNKGEHLVPIVRGCKENKKSLLFWESYCIATS